MRIRLFTGLIAVIALAGAAGATPSLEFSIGLCAGKTNAKARLACYDAIAAQLQAGQIPPAAAPIPIPAPAPVAAAPQPAPVAAAPQPAAVAAEPQPAPVAATPAPFVATPPPPAATPVTPEAQFGSEQIASKARQAAGQPEEVDAIHSALKAFSFAPNGRVIVTLDNGQIWRQIDGDTSQFRAKVGETITIEHAIFGSYSLTIEGHTSLIKVHRVH